MKARMKDQFFLFLLSSFSSFLEIEPSVSAQETKLVGGLAPELAIQGLTYLIIPPLIASSLEKSSSLLLIAFISLITSLMGQSFLNVYPIWLILTFKFCVSASLAAVNTICISLLITKNPTLFQFGFCLTVMRLMRSLGTLFRSQISLLGFQISRLFFVVCGIVVLGNINHLNNKIEEEEDSFYQKLIIPRQSTWELQVSPSRGKLAYCAFVGNLGFILTLLLGFLNQICYSLPWLATSFPQELTTIHFCIFISISSLSSLALPLIWRDKYIHIPLTISGIFLGLAALFVGPASFFHLHPSVNLFLVISSSLSFLGGTIYVCSIPRMIMSLQKKYFADVFKMRWMVCGFYLYMRGLADLMKVLLSVLPFSLVSSIIGISILITSVLLATRYTKENFRLQPLMN